MSGGGAGLKPGMDRAEISALARLYREELLERVVPFWVRHSPDREFGGYFSCLDRDGTVFDKDKFLWMQGRELWCLSRLVRESRLVPEYGPDPAWLELARLGAGFIRDKGRAPNGDFYFSLDREGRPLVQPYNIFSDCFCAAGFAEYSRVSGEDWARDLSLATYARIQERTINPKGVWTKQLGWNRPIKAMGMPMMQLWMADEFRGLVPEEELARRVDEALDQVLSLHVDRERKAVFERVLPDGSHPDCMEGRLLTPGHALETLWFAMRVARERDDRALVEDLASIMLWSVERGWDEKYGGIYYYQDYEGRPTEKLESSMKLWWVHVEALCAFLLAYKLTGSSAHLDWFRRIHEWSWARFPDPEHGEWYGYLDRSGEPAFGLKGGKWKGFFHLPRTLMECSRWLGEMEAACPPRGPYDPESAWRAASAPAAGRRGPAGSLDPDAR